MPEISVIKITVFHVHKMKLATAKRTSQTLFQMFGSVENWHMVEEKSINLFKSPYNRCVRARVCVSVSVL